MEVFPTPQSTSIYVFILLFRICHKLVSYCHGTLMALIFDIMTLYMIYKRYFPNM